MIVSDIEFPDKCPPECPLLKEPFYQGNLCTRCPVINCTGIIVMIDPDDYRHDWAVEFKKWFDSGCGYKKYPKLLFHITKSEE
jgi:hypothetical protein